MEHISINMPFTEPRKKQKYISSNEHFLLITAEIMRKYAKIYCRHNLFEKSNLNCEWYHASWQYMRLLGLVSTPDWLTNFYIKSFADACRPNVSEVLICGTADYGILDHLIKVIPQNKLNNITITIIDICETPLKICEWYSRWYEKTNKARLKLRLIQKNALATGFDEQKFDIITSYSFISRFPENERGKLVDEWYRILKPGGCVITSDLNLSQKLVLNKLDVAAGNDEVFKNLVIQQINEQKTFLRPVNELIVDLACEFARNQISYSIPSEKYLCGLFHSYDCLLESCIFNDEFIGERTCARIMATRAI